MYFERVPMYRYRITTTTTNKFHLKRMNEKNEGYVRSKEYKEGLEEAVVRGIQQRVIGVIWIAYDSQ